MAKTHSSLAAIRAARSRLLASGRQRLRRWLLARFQLAGSLGLGSAFALAIFEPRLRRRLAANIAGGSLLSLLILAGNGIWDLELGLTRRKAPPACPKA